MNTAIAPSIDVGSTRASELLDVLYEILASGLEPESATVSTSDIENFLHQHARSPKTRQEIEAFFTSGGLPMQVDAFARESGLRLTAVAAHTVSAASGELHTPESNTGRHAIAAAPKATTPVMSTPSPIVMDAVVARRGVSNAWIALAGVCLTLLGVCVVGGWYVMGLRDELARSQAAQDRTIAVLERVQARTEQLGQQLQVQSQSVADQRGEMDRLVQSFFPEPSAE